MSFPDDDLVVGPLGTPFGVTDPRWVNMDDGPLLVFVSWAAENFSVAASVMWDWRGVGANGLFPRTNNVDLSWIDEEATRAVVEAGGLTGS